MKVTAETVTDEQIRELMRSRPLGRLDLDAKYRLALCGDTKARCEAAADWNERHGGDP